MDRNISTKLESDKDFREKIVRQCKDYVKHGFDSVNYWIGEWDVAHDLLMAYAPLKKADMEALEKGHPRRFMLPMTATQITTMTTFIAQMLYGQDTPHKVTGRGPDDEVAAEHINTLLKWNAEQQPTYLNGYLWIQDAITFNRGIFYNSWATITRPVPTVVEAVEVDSDGKPVFDEAGNPVKYPTVRITEQIVGGFCRAEVVSPYDWACDPSVPLNKFQQGRFACHRFRVPWNELKRRSELPVDDPMYVRPAAVEELRDKKKPQGDLIANTTGTGASTIRPDSYQSRSAYERNRTNMAAPLSNDAATKEDPGIIECVELWVRLVPKSLGLHDGESPTVWQILIGHGDVLLAVNESTHAHGQFPYSVAEARPNAHYQFTPSYTLLLKGLQDHVDYLKNRHQEALQRTVGNVFIINPMKVDVDEFLNPDKEGAIITLKPTAESDKISDVIQQVPIKDLTQGFPDEMQMFVNYSENVTGANNWMQGTPGDTGGSATEFSGVQQMSAGRLASVARLLSVQGLVPQTRQFVTMFQQFLPAEQVLRYQPNINDAPPELASATSLSVSIDTIQGEFDFVAHDGTLPGTDSKKVAAIVRLLEAAQAFPHLFAPAPGNLNPKALLFEAARSSGVKVERFLYDSTTAAADGMAVASGAIPQAGPPPGVPLPDPAAGGESMPGIPMPPGPAPAMPGLPPVEIPGLPSASPTQVRPTNF